MYYHYSRIKSFLFSLILLLTVSETYAQVYPVQVTVVPTPPHRNYLNSFSEQGALSIFLTLTDFNSGAISVKLKMELNGSGYQFRSLPNNLVYVLNPGQPVQIPQEDFAVFFSSSGQTLNFNPSKLPEGNASICVDVVKSQSGELLSNNGCGYFYMGYGQPASLLQPSCNSTVQIPTGFPTTTDLRTIPLQFNFIPPIAPMGLQQEVENTLYIYNWLGTINTNPPLSPVGLSLAVDPIELGQITAHTLLPINNQLIVGQEYVWYVKSTLNGSTNQFQNGGWSAPCKFKYGSAQSIEETLAQGLSVEWIDLVSQSESKGTASWQVVKEDPNSSATFNQFILKYRRKVSASEEPFEWFSDTVNDLSKAIYQLEPATTYEASVAGRLGNFVSEPTEIRTFTTAPPRTYSCGVANFPGRATAFQPLSYADPGMKVKIGMFQLEFVSVQSTGQPGYFSGTGLIPIDFLFGAEARVKFSDLKIDKEYDVWAGTAHVITDGLDVWLEEQYQQFQEPIYVNGTVDSAYVSGSLAHVVIDGVDTAFTFPCTTCPVIINDVAGNQITIYPNGTVIWSTYLDVSNEQLNVPDTEIAVFEQNNETTANKGGFDPFEHIEWNANYEIITTNNAVNYFVGNKSIQKNQSSKINVSVPANKYTANNVKLSWNGLSTPLSPASSSVSNGKRIFIFNLPAFPNKQELEIYAVSDSLKIGKLNATVFEPIQKNVVVVPLAGTVDQSQLNTYLNNTLGEAGIDFTVTISDTIGVGKYRNNSSLNIPDATLLSKYSGKMRRIRNSYFDAHELEDDTYYLFVVSSLMDTVNNKSADGYMVRGKRIGFIQSGASLQTYAHELGHGIGAMEHSWKNNGPEQGNSNNLMDYSEGKNLTLAQWESLRNPKGGGFWDDEEDNEKQRKSEAYKWLSSELTISTSSTGWISKLNIDENDVFRTANNGLFSFTENQLARIQFVYLTNGIITDVQVSGTIYRLSDTKYKTELVDQQDSLYLVYEYPAIIFYNPQTNHNSRTIDGVDEKQYNLFTIDTIMDIQIRGNQLKSCADSVLYITGFGTEGKQLALATCPESPAGTDCNSTYYTQINNQDKQKVKQLLAQIVESSVGNPNYMPIRMVKHSTNVNYFDGIELQILKEKVSLLASYRAKKVVAYVFIENNENKIYDADQLLEIAQYAVNEVSATYPTKEIALHLINAGLYQQSGYFPNNSCFNETFVVSNPDMIQPGTIVADLRQGQTLNSSMLWFFSKLKKPFKRYGVYQKHDGSVAYTYKENVDDPSKDVYGLPYVHGAFHLVSKNKMLHDLTQASIVNLIDESESIQNAEQFAEAYEEMENMLRNFLTSSIPQWEQEVVNDPQYWQEGDISFDKLKESKLNPRVVLEEYNKQSKGEVIKDIVILSSGSYNGITPNHYYEFDVASRIADPLIYGGLDILGCIPGVDYVADGLGVLYSTARCNTSNMIAYSAGLATPFVGALAYKTGTKFMGYFVKKEGTQYILEAKLLTESTEDWVKISKDIPVADVNIATAKTDLNKSNKLSAVSQSERKLAYEVGVNTVESALVKSLSQTLKSVHWRLVNGGMQVVEQGNVIKYLAQDGDEIARIENGIFTVSKTKGSIPNPSTYLDETFITNHVNKFEQEGAGFIVVKNWTENGSYNSMPSRKFVGLRSEMDAVITKYKAQGNDWTVLRDELNLGSNTDLSGEEIYYIKIDGNDSRFSFDVPNGNEGGAIVGEWVPGGYTKNGTTEAALVGSENIVHDKNMNQLLSNFSGKWEKIK